MNSSAMHSLPVQILRRSSSSSRSTGAATSSNVAALLRARAGGVVARTRARHLATASDDGSRAAATSQAIIPSSLRSLHLHRPFACGWMSRGVRGVIDIGQIQLPRWQSSSPRRMRFGDCRTLEEAIAMTHDHLDHLTSRNLSAFWTEVPKRLRQRNHGRQFDPSVASELTAILLRTIELVKSFGYRDLAQTAMGIAKTIKIVDKDGGKRLQGGDPREVLHGLLVGHDSENKQFIFSEVAAAAMPILHRFDPRHLSNLIYAFGLSECVVGFDDGTTFFDVIAGVAMSSLRQFNGQDLSNMLWAYGNARISNPMLFKSAGDVIVESGSLDEFAPQALSIIVWAFASREESHPKLFKKIGDHIVALDNLRAFDPQALANILWAYATARESDPKLFMKVAGHIVSLDNLRAFEPQNLSNIVWAYATAKESDPKLFKKVASYIVALGNLREFASQALSNTVWAYATAKESEPKLFRKIADHVVSLDSLRAFNAQDLSITVWAFATAGESNPKLYQKVADHIVALDNLSTLAPQALSNIVWAYATAKEPHPELLWKIADAAFAQQHNFNPRDVANFLWAYATNGQIDEEMFRSWEPVAASQLSGCNGQDLTNIAWAYAVANVSATSLFNDDFVNVCIEKKTEFSFDELSQLHQWQLWQRELGLEVRPPSSLEEKCHKAFLSRAPRPSALQDDVVSSLHSIGLEPDEEVLTASGYRIDATVDVNGVKVAVEVDGPSHFVGREPSGSTLLKHRQVTNLDGMQLVSVPYWEWNKLRKDSGKKQQYLRAALGLD